MAVTDYQISEIQRKAKAGIPMSAPTAEKQAIYDSYKPFDQAGYLKKMQDQVNSTFDNQTAARMAQFNAQRDKALGLVNQQKAQVAPQYAGMRNQADVVSAQNVSKLREMMAANGISGSGENVTANVGLQSARQGALSQLNLQEQETNNDFNRQIADINDTSKLDSMIADLNAQRSQALMQAGDRADELGYNRLQDSKQFDYQTGRDAVNDGRYDKETAYGHSRDAIGDKNYQNETTYNHGRDAIADKRYLEELTHARNQAALSSRRSGSGGGSSYGSSGGSSIYSAPLPKKPTAPKIMTEQHYIDTIEEPVARHNGTARVVPGSTDYIKKMKKIYDNM